MGILIKASSQLWPQLKARLGRRPQPSPLQEGQHSSLGRMREDEMCQLFEAKQEPSFVSNTFFKQVRGVGTQLKGMSLSRSLSRKPNPEDFYLYPCKTSSPHCLEMFALAKGRQKTWQSPGAWGSGTAPAACRHPAYTVTPEPRGRCPQWRVAHPWLYTGSWVLTGSHQPPLAIIHVLRVG